jgi:hypothetical protein
MRLLSFIPEPPIEGGQKKSALVPRGRKFASITLFIPFLDHIPRALIGRQPGDEPGAEESNYYSN